MEVIPWLVDMKLGRRRNYHKGQAALKIYAALNIYANQPAFSTFRML